MHKYLNKYKIYVVLIVVLTMIANTLSAVYSIVYKNVVDYAISLNSKYIDFIVILLLITVVNTLITYVSYHYLLKLLKVKVSTSVKLHTVKTILTNSISFFKRNSTGKLITSIVEDTDVIGEYASLYHFIYISNTFRFVISYLTMWYLSKELAIITILTVPLFIFLSTRSFKNYSSTIRKERESKDLLNNKISNCVTTAPAIKNMNLNSLYIDELKRERINYEESAKQLIKKQGVITSLRDLLYSVMPTIIFVVGIILSFNGYISIGTAVAFVGLVDGAYIPVSEILYFRSLRIKYLEYEKRHNELLTEHATFKSSITDHEIRSTNMRKVFTDELTIDYSDVRINDYGIYIVEGANGSGKTTLLNILFGSDCYDSGEALSSHNIAYLPQDRISFSLSLNNIIQDIDSDIVRQLVSELKIKHSLTEIIDSQKLSGGEYKKLAVLITLSKQSSFVFLDEPFNDLERDAVNTLKEYIIKDSANRTYVIVDHTNAFDSALPTKIILD